VAGTPSPVDVENKEDDKEDKEETLMEERRRKKREERRRMKREEDDKRRRKKVVEVKRRIALMMMDLGPVQDERTQRKEKKTSKCEDRLLRLKRSLHAHARALSMCEAGSSCFERHLRHVTRTKRRLAREKRRCRNDKQGDCSSGAYKEWRLQKLHQLHERASLCPPNSTACAVARLSKIVRFKQQAKVVWAKKCGKDVVVEKTQLGDDFVITPPPKTTTTTITTKQTTEPTTNSPATSPTIKSSESGSPRSRDSDDSDDEAAEEKLDAFDAVSKKLA
jgi:hypothetical protein